MEPKEQDDYAWRNNAISPLDRQRGVGYSRKMMAPTLELGTLGFETLLSKLY